MENMNIAGFTPRRWIAVLMVLMFCFNGIHAYFMDHAREGGAETVQHFVMELEHGSDCGDLCEMHHLFHFIAIVTTPVLAFQRLEVTTLFLEPAIREPAHYPSPPQRPPIA
jgi:hypothetical protein